MNSKKTNYKYLFTVAGSSHIMDFNFKKPSHLAALLLLLGSLALFIAYPVFSLYYSAPITSLYTESMTSFQRLTIEVILLLTQLFFVFIGLIIIPILWYILVNRISLKEMFARVQLKQEEWDLALLWGVITVIFAFALIVMIGLIYMYVTNIDTKTLSNIPDLQLLFSIPSLYILVTLQPFCEEFFYRGFLFEKITKMTSPFIAIVITSVLFGISHLSYTHAYAAVTAVILGVLLALVVLKTKNLFSAIFAHVVINIVSLTLFIYGTSFWM